MLHYRLRKPHAIWAVLILSATLLAPSPAPASAIPLDVLLDNPSASITVQDKTFGNFRLFDSFVFGLGGGADPANIFVSGALIAGEIGLTFTAPQFAMVAGPSSTQVTQFVYDVTPSPQFFIVDNTLRLTSFQLGGSDTAQQQVIIEEQVLDSLDQTIAFKIVKSSDQLEANAGFTPQSKITVNTAIALINDDPEDSSVNFVSIEEWNQTFSQTPVPEPSTMLLLGSGLAGLGFFRRRRKGRKNTSIS